jgi:uncharacterized protein YpmS
VRRVVIVLLVFLAACSSQSSESVPAEDATGVTDSAPKLTTTTAATSTTVAVDVAAFVAEGSAACTQYKERVAEYETAFQAAIDAGGKTTDLALTNKEFQNVVGSMGTLDEAIDDIALVDRSIIPIEEIQRRDSLWQSWSQLKVTTRDIYPDLKVVYAAICDRISQYR